MGCASSNDSNNRPTSRRTENTNSEEAAPPNLEGKVLLLGGSGSELSVEFYHPQDWAKCQKHDRVLGDQTSLSCRIGHIAQQINNKIVIAGGSGRFGTSSDYLDVDRLQLDVGPTLNKPRQYSSSAVYSDKVFIFGGTDKTSNSIEILSVGKQRWKLLGPMPEFRSHSAATVLGDNIFVIAGLIGTSEGVEKTISNCVGIYHPETDSWLSGLSLVHPRSSHGIATFQGSIVVAGGKTEAIGTITDSVERWDPRQAHWSRMTPLCDPRSGHCLVNFNERLYIVGGRDSSGEMIRTVEEYDSKMDKWKTLEMQLISERCSAAAVCLL